MKRRLIAVALVLTLSGVGASRLRAMVFAPDWGVESHRAAVPMLELLRLVRRDCGSAPICSGRSGRPAHHFDRCPARESTAQLCAVTESRLG